MAFPQLLAYCLSSLGFQSGATLIGEGWSQRLQTLIIVVKPPAKGRRATSLKRLQRSVLALLSQLSIGSHKPEALV